MFTSAPSSDPSVLWLVFGLWDNDVVSDIRSAEGEKKKKNNGFSKMGVSKLEKGRFSGEMRKCLIFLAFILCHRYTAEADKTLCSSGTSITL